MSRFKDLLANFDSEQADFLSSDGSQMSFNLQPGLIPPSDAVAVTVGVVAASMWWTVPNFINVKLNLFVNTPTASQPDLKVDYSTIVPTGLYDLKAMNNWLQGYLTQRNAEVGQDFDVEVICIENKSLGKVSTLLQLYLVNPPGLFVPSLIAEVQEGDLWTRLGYEPGVTLKAFYEAPSSNIGSNYPLFDTLQYFLIGSSLSSAGFALNGLTSGTRGIIARVNITAEAGEQIVFEPSQPLDVDCPNLLIREGIRSCTFSLLDQAGYPVNTGGQPWSALVRIRYFFS
jgi:hypothetical protein